VTAFFRKRSGRDFAVEVRAEDACSQSIENLDVAPHCVMALRLFGETAALRDFDPAYARLGSKADIRACPRDVRFTPESGHWNSTFELSRGMSALRQKRTSRLVRCASAALPDCARSTFGDRNAYGYREVVQSDKGLWIYSTFRRRQQRCVCPHSAVERAGLRSLNEGQTVEYEIQSERGKESATNLRVK
jgi:hypothetical protein